MPEVAHTSVCLQLFKIVYSKYMKKDVILYSMLNIEECVRKMHRDLPEAKADSNQKSLSSKGKL